MKYDTHFCTSTDGTRIAYAVAKGKGPPAVMVPDNVYGGAVNIAARVAAASAAGETLVSGTVRDLARTSASVSFEDRGEQALRGINEPQRLFAVVASGQAEA